TSKFWGVIRLLMISLRLIPLGEGSGTPTESHHTPTFEASQSSQHELPSPSLPHVTTATIPLVIPTESLSTIIPSDNPPLRQYTRRTRIAQSSVLPPVADKPASPLKDDSQGEACPTDSIFEADQDRANIAKTSTLPSDLTPRVTSLAADEGSMQHKLDELTALCTSLQRQQLEMVAKFEAQELEINSLKARIKVLEDKDRGVAEQSRHDAPIKGRRLNEGEEAAERVSDDTEEMATVLTSMNAVSILTSRGVQVVPTAVEVATATVSIPTGSGLVSTASPTIPTVALIFTTAIESTPYTRRKGKEKMVKSDTPKKKKLQEQIDVQVAKELEEEMARDAQRMNEQIARDAEIARIHAEEELQMLIDGLDRNNETQREFYTSVLRNQAGWKAKHFKEMTLEEIKEKSDPVWKQFQYFIPLGSKEESKRFKRKGFSLEQESVKKLKTSEEVKETEEVPKEMMQMVHVEEGEGSSTPTEPHHTPSPEAQPTSSTTPSSPTLPSSSVLPPVADEPASPLRDVSQGEACPTNSGFGADKDRENIAKTSTLPYDSAPWVTSPAADEGSMQQTLDELTALCTSLQRKHSEMVAKFEAQELEIHKLKARVKLLEDRERVVTERSGDDAPIKGRNLDEREAAAERVSDDTEEMATVLTSMDTTTILASGAAKVPTGSGSIPTAGPPAAVVPTGSDVVLTAGLIFAIATVVTPYPRRKGKETMVESETLKKKKIQEQMDIQMARQLEEEMERDAQRMNEQIARDAEIARIQAEEELQIMIDRIDMNNETVAKYLQEYHQFATELPLERRIELISDLIKYQDNYVKEEAKRFKRKGIRFKQESVKKLKTSEEVSEEVKTPDEVPEEKVKEMMQLVPIKEVYVEALKIKHPIIDWKVHTEDREDLNQLWALVKESLSIRPPTSDKEILGRAKKAI
nr:hypothetical protein [Tanacetum cinerariifolium]